MRLPLWSTRQSGMVSGQDSGFSALRARARRVAFVTLLLMLATLQPAWAQVTITLDRYPQEGWPRMDQGEYGWNERMLVTVTPAPGKRVSKPRFASISDGAPVPGPGSSIWMEFPAVTTTQTFTLIAPSDAGLWWLVLLDGNRLVQRIPFNVLHPLVVLGRKKAELEASLGITPGTTAPENGSGTNSPTSSARGHLRMASPRELARGEQFDVVVTLPAAPSGESAAASLRWGYTIDLPWEQKAKVPESNDFAPEVSIPQPTTNPIAVYAPFTKAGRFELRLFRGQTLLDVLAITVK